MLITMLRGRKKNPAQARPRAGGKRTVASIVDISGPLPAGPATPVQTESHPYRESALVGTALRGTTWRRDRTEMSTLPREVDPFESDFPWIGWSEPRHESFIRSDSRSPTFERDLQRVLAIFAN